MLFCTAAFFTSEFSFLRQNKQVVAFSFLWPLNICLSIEVTDLTDDVKLLS